MSVGWDTYRERLGPIGTRLTLATLLERADVHSLLGRRPSADAAERAQQVLDAADEDAAIGERALELLDARCANSKDSPQEWSERELRENMAQALREPDAHATTVLHRLARLQRPKMKSGELRAAAELIAPQLLEAASGTIPKYVAKVAQESGPRRELEQAQRELERRVRQLEGQLERALKHSADLEDRLARRSSELAEAKSELKKQREQRPRTDKDLADVLKQQSRDIVRLTDLTDRLVTLQEAQARTAATVQEAIFRDLADLRHAVRSAGGEDESLEDVSPSRARRRRSDGQRVALFVDVQNMFYGARERSARVDFEALLAAASTGGRRVARAVAYVVEAPDTDQRGFIHLLEMKTYEVKRKPLRIRSDRSMKGNWDLQMALDALMTAQHADVIALATGDGDFLPLVRQLKMLGRRVELFGFTRSTAPDLREAADRFFPITKRLLMPLDQDRPAGRKKKTKRPSGQARTPS